MKNPIHNQINNTLEQGSNQFTDQDLNKVLSKQKTAARKSRKLKMLPSDFVLLWSLLQDYKSGQYREVPWKLIAATGFAMAYLINPFDLIPDVVPLLGFSDDVSIFGLIFLSFKSEIAKYKSWKNNASSTHNSMPDNSAKEDK